MLPVDSIIHVKTSELVYNRDQANYFQHRLQEHNKSKRANANISLKLLTKDFMKYLQIIYLFWRDQFPPIFKRIKPIIV